MTWARCIPIRPKSAISKTHYNPNSRLRHDKTFPVSDSLPEDSPIVTAYDTAAAMEGFLQDTAFRAWICGNHGLTGAPMA